MGKKTAAQPPVLLPRRDRWIVPLLIFATFATYWPAIGHDFVNWDDFHHLTQNPRFNPPRLQNTLLYWTEPGFFGFYIPVTYTAWTFVAMVARTSSPDVMGTQLNPYVFHFANVALHVACALVVFAILKLLVRRDWPAAMGALLFSLHPVQVETVAWISGFRDLLGGLLSLVAVWAYLRYASIDVGDFGLDRRAEPQEISDGDRPMDAAVKRGKWARLHYIVGTAAFILAMLSKPAAVVVPLIAWILDYGILRRPMGRSLRVLLPWFLLTIPCILWTKHVQQPINPAETVPLWIRPLIATDAIAFYLYKLFWPLELGVHYGRTPRIAWERGWIYLTWIAPAALAMILWVYRRRRPWLIAAAGVFAAGVAQVSGLIPFAFQEVSTVTDHYLYLAMLGPAMATAFLLSFRWNRGMIFMGIILLSMLGARSWDQTGAWKDTRALFEHALKVNPDSWLALNNLATRLIEDQRLPEAIDYSRRALKIQPEYAPAHTNLGRALHDQGKLTEAIAAYREAIRHDPQTAIPRSNLAGALAEQGNIDEAITQYLQALRLDPKLKEAKVGLAQARENQQSPTESP